jgi:hypothetical protein
MSSFPKEDFSLSYLALRTENDLEIFTRRQVKKSYDACNDKGCETCLYYFLPELIKHHKNVGILHFIFDIQSRSEESDFDKAVESFHESLRWASFWKEKYDLKEKIDLLRGKTNLKNFLREMSLVFFVLAIQLTLKLYFVNLTYF